MEANLGSAHLGIWWYICRIPRQISSGGLVLIIPQMKASQTSRGSHPQECLFHCFTKQGTQSSNAKINVMLTQRWNQEEPDAMQRTHKTAKSKLKSHP